MAASVLPSNFVVGNLIVVLHESETKVIGVVQTQPSGINASNRTCFSVFGNVKADGTPFTAADCPGGTALTPPPNVIFSITR